MEEIVAGEGGMGNESAEAAPGDPNRLLLIMPPKWSQNLLGPECCLVGG